MTTPRSARWKDPVVDDLLAGVTVAPGRYGASQGRYAVPQGRYATSQGRYVTPPQGRYAIPQGRYATQGRYAKKQPIVGRSGLRHTIVVVGVPPPRPVRVEEQLLWLPMYEVAECYSDGYDMALLLSPGELLDFTEANVSYNMLHYYSGDPESEGDFKLQVISVTCEEETFEPLSRWGCGCDDQDLPLEDVHDLREQLALYPELVAGELDPGDLRVLRTWVGLPAFPTQEQTVAAIVADPMSGLGGAALDYAAWLKCEHFGDMGKRLAEILQEAADEDFIQCYPVENLLLYSGSLRPGSAGTRHPFNAGVTLYTMSGDYAVSRIGYHSDPTGQTPTGWRSVWIEPYNGDGS